MDPQLGATLTELVLLTGLLFVSAAFVAVEFGLVAVHRARLEAQAASGNRAATWILAILSRHGATGAPARLGFVLTTLVVGAFGVPIVGRWLSALPGVVGLPIAAGIVGVLLALAYVVVALYLPRAVAVQQPEATLRLLALPLVAFHRLALPVVVVLEGLSNAVLGRFGLRPGVTHETIHTEAELRLLVTASQEGGVLEATEEEMIHKVIAFADKEAHQVMVPRTEVRALRADLTIDAFIQAAATDQVHTRFPVYEGSIDSVIGIIHLKDAVLAASQQATDRPIRSVMRPVLVVPETIHIDELLRQLRRRRMHMAVLVDEFGGTAGIVTMEDLLEEIVGEIQDEFDAEAPGVADRHDGTYTLDGMISIEEFNERFGQGVADPAYDTIAGHVFGQLGRVAVVGDEVTIDGLILRVEAMDGLRIASLGIRSAEGATLSVRHDHGNDVHPRTAPHSVTQSDLSFT